MVRTDRPPTPANGHGDPIGPLAQQDKGIIMLIQADGSTIHAWLSARRQCRAFPPTSLFFHSATTRGAPPSRTFEGGVCEASALLTIGDKAGGSTAAYPPAQN